MIKATLWESLEIILITGYEPAMKKSDKKLEKQIREALTNVCEIALEQVSGFKWLTHIVNFSSFPESLLIVCVFDSNAELKQTISNHQDVELINLINKELLAVGIKIRAISQKVAFDSEENCSRENDGKWNERFKHYKPGKQLLLS